MHETSSVKVGAKRWKCTRLSRTLDGLMPGDAEVLGLPALMEIQAARCRNRQDCAGALSA
jgi:predicted RNA polymerase sigma factor